MSRGNWCRSTWPSSPSLSLIYDVSPRASPACGGSVDSVSAPGRSSKVRVVCRAARARWHGIPQRFIPRFRHGTYRPRYLAVRAVPSTSARAAAAKDRPPRRSADSGCSISETSGNRSRDAGRSLPPGGTWPTAPPSQPRIPVSKIALFLKVIPLNRPVVAIVSHRILLQENSITEFSELAQQ